MRANLQRSHDDARAHSACQSVWAGVISAVCLVFVHFFSMTADYMCLQGARENTAFEPKQTV